MSYWTGTEWAPEPQAPVKRPSRKRHAFEAILEGTLVAALVVGLLAGTTFAGGKGNGRGGGHAATAGGPALSVDPGEVRAGQSFDVTGCGFDGSQGNVIVSFTGGSWGSPLDGGCFRINGIPALSGDTLAPGTYDVTALQYVSGRWRAVAATTVRVVSD